MRNKLITILLVVALLLTACRGEVETLEASETKTSEDVIPSKIPEDTIVKSIPYMPPSLLPDSWSDDMLSIVSPVYEYNFEMTAEGEFVYFLAEKLEISDDEKTYTLTLKDDITWSDGKSIGADDFILGMDYHEMMHQGNSPRFISGNEAKVTKLDDRTIEFVLPEPYIQFSKALMFTYPLPAHIFESAEKVDAKYFRSPDMVTSGAYTVKEYNEDSIVFEAKDDYYRGDLPIKKIVYRVVPRGSTEQVMFENDELSYMRIETPEVYEKYSNESDKYNITSFSESRINYLQLNPHGPAKLKDNPEARKAIFLALNQTEILDLVYGTEALAHEATSFIHPDSIYHQKGMTWYEQNLEEAKRLSESSGLSGQKLVYIYNADRANMDQIATAIQHQLSQIGVEVEVRGEDSGTFFPHFFYVNAEDENGLGWDLGTNGFNAERGIDAGMSQALYRNLGGTNGFSEKVVEITNNSLRSTSLEERMKLYSQQHEAVKEECWIYPMPYTQFVIVSQKNVSGFEKSPFVPGPLDWTVIKAD